jgi:outer membrane protein
MFKRPIILLGLLALLFTPVWAGAANLKIGIVDVNDIISKSPEGKRAQDNIKRKMEELGRPLEQKRQDFGRQLEEFEKQRGVMKEDARKRREDELQKKMAELQKQAQDADRSMTQLQERELGPVFQKMEKAVEQVANDEKLDLVFPKQGVFIRTKELDITEKVRSKFR